MIRAVADTNVAISALLSHGTPQQVIDLARIGVIELFATETMLRELADVLSRGKFEARLRGAGVSIEQILFAYRTLITTVLPVHIDPVILDDPADDAVLAAGVAADASFIISGDNHLLSLRTYRGIKICTPSDLLSQTRNLT